MDSLAFVILTLDKTDSDAKCPEPKVNECCRDVSPS